MAKRGAVHEDPETQAVPDRPDKAAADSQPGLGDNHPLNDIIGTHEGPVWDRVLKSIKRNRLRDDRAYARSLDEDVPS